MDSESNSDAVDILSELESDNQNIPETSKEQNVVESDNQNIPETPKEQNLVESEKAEPDNSSSVDENKLKTKPDQNVRNVIFIGNKTIMTYVNSTLTQLSATPIVTIKARGKRITQAVDVSQFIMKRMNSVGYKISDVRISSESLVSQDGKTRNVSLLEIDISHTDT